MIARFKISNKLFHFMIFQICRKILYKFPDIFGYSKNPLLSIMENHHFQIEFDQQFKKNTNLKVIRKQYQQYGQIEDYLNVYPEVCLFKMNEDRKWIKLPIGGPLFLCTVENQDDLTLLLLNNTQTNEDSAFYKILTPQTKYATKNNQIYIKADPDYIITFIDKAHVDDLMDHITRHYPGAITNDAEALHQMNDEQFVRLANRLAVH